MSVTTRRHHPEAGAEVWLGVHDASELLGVSPATLRRWSVAGKVQAFRTPGGHRRFARSSLERLLPPAASRTGPVVLGAPPERLSQALRWHVPPGAGPRVALMVDGVLALLRTRSVPEEEAALAGALEAASTLGRVAARNRCPLDGVLSTARSCRGVVLDQVGAAAVGQGLVAADVARVVARAGAAVDRLVIALVGSYATVERGQAAD